MSFSTIITEGGLLPADLLAQIAAADLPGQRPSDFEIASKQTVNDLAADVWQIARTQWQVFYKNFQALGPNNSATSLTRQKWISPLLQNLGYEPTANSNAYQIDGRTYAISHRADPNPESPPIHIAGAHQRLDARAPSGRPRLSPHALMQEYLNSSEQVWGIITNGLRLRLLRNSSRFARPTFVEFDLEAMFNDEKFGEFVLMFRLLHRSRLPKDSSNAQDCWLERYHQQAVEQGGRVREGLRVGVEAALKHLGDGLLSHPANQVLRDKLIKGLTTGKDSVDSLTAQGFYRQLLRLVYRMLFLMVAEERGLIAALPSHDTEDLRSLQSFDSVLKGVKDNQPLTVYFEHYSMSRLRRLVMHPSLAYSQHDDLWRGLQITFQLFEGTDTDKPAALGLAPLDGDLFGETALRDLNGQQLGNRALVAAIKALSLYHDAASDSQWRVNYGALDVEELGSVYESLLDLRPVIGPNARSFLLVAGTERKTTGSYYTRPELVQELIKSALEPVLHERVWAQPRLTPQQREAALLDIKVCDPTCGSGHFLLAAARRLGRDLARIRSGEDQPTPTVFREAVRDVIQHCIFGVDLNPLAVDLCKLALWLEGHSIGKPLSFLDHHIRHGNGLIGATRALVAAGIPDDAFKPVTGDDKAVSSALRKRNKTEREQYQAGVQQHDMFGMLTPKDDGQQYADAMNKLDNQASDSVKAVRQKANDYQTLRGKLRNEITRFNLWTAAFFLPQTKAQQHLIPTTKTLADYERNPNGVRADLIGAADGLAAQANFFHWELEFPQVFSRGERQSGFDVILGNPPWERIKLQEQEHFVDVREIMEASNKAARERVIEAWRNGDARQRLRIAEFDTAKQLAESSSRFIRASGRFPLTAVGDVNTYALFAEHARNMIADTGRAGIIVPTGIATDDSTKAFFGELNNRKQLVSLFDIENREKIFADVDSRFKFCLLTFGQTTKPAQLMFFITNMEQLSDSLRRFTLSAEEVALINPNTRTAPVFRTNADAELTKKIYRRVPVLINERVDTSLSAKQTKVNPNPWGVSFMTMFHMSNDSGLFKNEPGEGLLPLYEAKLLHQFTHRWASYEGEKTNDFTLDGLRDTNQLVTPRYWVEQQHVENRLAERNWQRGWLLAFRDITNATNERTAIFSLLPRVAVGHTAPLIFVGNEDIGLTVAFLATLNSLTLDFIARQKIGGTHLTFTYLNQFAVLPPETFGKKELAFIVPRVLELVYTAYDLQAFAQDVWAEADVDLRGQIIEQRRANHRATQQYADDSIANGVKHLNLFQNDAPPPFIWDEQRRAVLRAELDALIAKLYGLTRDELRYILDPQDVHGENFPGETFRVLKEKEIRQYGEYRTRRLVLEAWDDLGDKVTR